MVYINFNHIRKSHDEYFRKKAGPNDFSFPNGSIDTSGHYRAYFPNGRWYWARHEISK